MNQNHKTGLPGNKPASSKVSMKTRGAAIRAQKRNQDDANKAISQYSVIAQKPMRANVITDQLDKLKITFLGGQNDIGENNMQVIEWQNDAIVFESIPLHQGN